jgi:hypothetical protein
MFKQYDQESYTEYQFVLYNAEDSAQNGDHAKTHKSRWLDEEESKKYATIEFISELAKMNGFDTAEIIERTEVIKRYAMVK